MAVNTLSTTLADESEAKRRVIVLAIDQAEELFLGEGAILRAGVGSTSARC